MNDFMTWLVNEPVFMSLMLFGLFCTLFGVAGWIYERFIE